MASNTSYYLTSCWKFACSECRPWLIKISTLDLSLWAGETNQPNRDCLQKVQYENLHSVLHFSLVKICLWFVETKRCLVVLCRHITSGWSYSLLLLKDRLSAHLHTENHVQLGSCADLIWSIKCDHDQSSIFFYPKLKKCQKGHPKAIGWMEWSFPNDCRL